MAENLEKISGPKERGSPSHYSKCSIRQKLAFPKLSLRVQRNIFSLFLKILNFWNFFGLSAFYVFARTFCSKKFFLGIIISWIFLTLSEQFSGFGQRIFGRVVKTAFYLFRGTFWEQNIFFSKFNFIIFTIGIVKNGFYDTIGAIWEFLKKNVNVFTPNYQNPGKKPTNLGKDFPFVI